GLVVFPFLPAGEYDLRLVGGGILRRGFRVFPSRESDLGNLAIDQAGDAPGGATTTRFESAAEVSTVITTQQVERVPVLGRNPIQLVSTVAGAGFTTRTSTTINGLRPGYAGVSLDGVNIQDHFYRSIEGVADTPFLAQVSEIAVITTNPSTVRGFGSGQVILNTPRGTNQYHGSLYAQNRNSWFAANTWFNNRDGVEKPFLNRNQVGASFGGPVLRGRLFFYGNYEALRVRQQNRTLRSIFTEDARRAIYTYEDASGTVRKVNVLQAAGVSPDPAMQQLLQQVPGAESINNFLVGDSRATLMRNAAGYSYNLRANSSTDNASTKLDWQPLPSHSFYASYYLQRTNNDEPAFANDFSTRPNTTSVKNGHLFSIASAR